MVQINDTPAKPSYQIKTGDHVSLRVPKPSPLTLVPEEVSFSVIFEDSWVIVLYKPPGIVVHPGPGHASGTLVHGLLKHCGDLSGIGGKLRPGIVHRLDKDTSGLMLVAKNDMAIRFFPNSLKTEPSKRNILRWSMAFFPMKAAGLTYPSPGTPSIEKRWQSLRGKGRNALTLWKKIACYKEGLSLLSITIKTGRTHQIRVHFSHLGHPLVGDTVYGHGPDTLKKRFLKQNPKLVSAVKRQMLHAARIGLFTLGRKRMLNLNRLFPKI